MLSRPQNDRQSNSLPDNLVAERQKLSEKRRFIVERVKLSHVLF